ncbi:MAG: NADH-quinone oxidoreductase subunit B family protein [Promethearchaeota archaeon]
MGLLKRLVDWSRRKSPWLLHFNAGSCNCCDIEILAALMPRFDIERFGALLKASPRHADVLVCTGPVTLQQAKRLKRIYEQTPDPKFVMVVGTCGSTGGVFRGCYHTHQGIDNIIPVDVYVPGCPARPESILFGAVRLLQKLEAVQKGEST